MENHSIEQGWSKEFLIRGPRELHLERKSCCIHIIFTLWHLWLAEGMAGLTKTKSYTQISFLELILSKILNKHISKDTMYIRVHVSACTCL